MRLIMLHCADMGTLLLFDFAVHEIFSGPYFPAFGLNTERHFISLRTQSECRKIGTRKNSVFGHISHGVVVSNFLITFISYMNKSYKNAVQY